MGCGQEEEERDHNKKAADLKADIKLILAMYFKFGLF